MSMVVPTDQTIDLDLHKIESMLKNHSRRNKMKSERSSA